MATPDESDGLSTDELSDDARPVPVPAPVPEQTTDSDGTILTPEQHLERLLQQRSQQQERELELLSHLQIPQQEEQPQERRDSDGTIIPPSPPPLPPADYRPLQLHPTAAPSLNLEPSSPSSDPTDSTRIAIVEENRPDPICINDKGICWEDRLPREIWTLIFTFAAKSTHELNALALVDKLFRQISTEDTFWKPFYVARLTNLVSYYPTMKISTEIRSSNEGQDFKVQAARFAEKEISGKKPPVCRGLYIKRKKELHHFNVMARRKLKRDQFYQRLSRIVTWHKRQVNWALGISAYISLMLFTFLLMLRLAIPWVHYYVPFTPIFILCHFSMLCLVGIFGMLLMQDLIWARMYRGPVKTSLVLSIAMATVLLFSIFINVKVELGWLARILNVPWVALWLPWPVVFFPIQITFLLLLGLVYWEMIGRPIIRREQGFKLKWSHTLPILVGAPAMLFFLLLSIHLLFVDYNVLPIIPNWATLIVAFIPILCEEFIVFLVFLGIAISMHVKNRKGDTKRAISAGLVAVSLIVWHAVTVVFAAGGKYVQPFNGIELLWNSLSLIFAMVSETFLMGAFVALFYFN